MIWLILAGGVVLWVFVWWENRRQARGAAVLVAPARELASQAQVQLAGGVPFLSDKDLQAALDKAGAPRKTSTAIVSENASARITGLRASLSLLAVVAVIAPFFSRLIPTRQPPAAPGSEPSA